MGKKENKKEKKAKFPSELRYDVASKDWVVIATGRAKKPEMFKEERRKIGRIPKKDCPFCKIETQRTPTLIFSRGKKAFLELDGKVPKDWTTIVIPNKYPAFVPGSKLEERKEGKFYRAVNAHGFHEVVVTKDHDKHIALFSLEETKELIDVYHTRYRELMKKPLANYIFIFHNHGREAGASVYHPHSQIITTPLIDIDVRKALSKASEYKREHKACVYCQMNKWEIKTKERVVFENKDFVAICPFASKMAFQTIISPKRHASNFEELTEPRKWTLAQALQKTLAKINKGLGNPAYNFYLHSAPSVGNKYPFYHWHFTILPKTSTHAGFELGAGIEISTIEPERAAAYLRKQ